MINYVLGFVFGVEGDTILLLRKARPGWMAGLLNGVGGKVEEGESPLEAMDREWVEEIDGLGFVDWKLYALLRCKGYQVWIFRADVNDLGSPWSTSPEEVVEILGRDELESELSKIPNLSWLVPMACPSNRGDWPFVIEERAVGLDPEERVFYSE